jgi:hypothetical protein
MWSIAASLCDTIFDDIVLRGRLNSLGMGRFDDVLSATEVAAIHAYLNNEATMALHREPKPNLEQSVPNP